MKARFTGHDTFPLRHGWLYKAVDLINNNGLLSTSDVTQIEKTIAALGVGKNMVNAIKYWAETARVINVSIKDRSVVQQVTSLGEYLFDKESGRDPYMENVGTVWLVHFLINFDDSQLTAYRYFFNFSNNVYFEKSKFIDDLTDDCLRFTGTTVSNKSTIKKDVDCFLASYAEKIGSARKKVIDEDHFASSLTELKLIKDMGRGYFQSGLDERPSLPLHIFMYALVEYFNYLTLESKSQQVSFDDLLSKPLSPGKIFRLSESELGRLLDESVIDSKGLIGWIDSLGLKQVTIKQELLENPKDLLDEYYAEHSS